MSEHTPGEWIVSDGDIIAITWYDTDEGIEDCRELVVSMPLYDPNAPYVDHGFIEGQVEANAQLIAAAPDLLEACKKMLSAYANVDGGDALHEIFKALNMMKIAIAKAERG